ncbi:MAG: YHS domain-containing protein [Phycisphaerales bacterium]|nr:YHS domain-containing protein [Phycisphaerales bacterium]
MNKQSYSKILTELAMRRQARRQRILEHAVQSGSTAAFPAVVTVANKQARNNRKMVDPVCGTTLSPSTAMAQAIERGLVLYFCSAECLADYARDPQRYGHY